MQTGSTNILLDCFEHNITIKVFDCGPINSFLLLMKNISEVLLRELRCAVLAQLSNNFIYHTRLRNTSELGFPRKLSSPLKG